MGVARDASKSSPVEWLFAALVLAVGVANLLFVHPVPALAYALVSLVYLPPADAWLGRRFGIRIHPVAKIVLGIAIVMFTLGVSDLGDMID
jgi:hypothetical protein